MAGRKGGSFQGPLTKSGSFRKNATRRKTSKKKKSKVKKPLLLNTTQRTLSLLPETASKAGMFVELDKLLSQSNSKLYRQGMNYHARVGLISEGTADNDTEFEIYVLPKDHRTIGAFKMARSIYDQAMKDELEIRPELKSAWTDFKIETYGPGQHASAYPMFTNAAKAYQASYTTNEAFSYVTLISDSYQVSEITSNAGDQKRFSLLDDTDSTHWNVFVEYTNYLQNRADPDSAAENPAYGDASPVLTEMAELADKGDEPPYQWGWKLRDSGGSVVPHRLTLELAGTISAGPVTSQQRPSFVDVEAPLGLIFIKTSGNYFDATIPELNVKVMKGNYKGVKADRIYPINKLLGF